MAEQATSQAAPPEVEQRSMGGGPITIPNTTTLANLLPLVYNLSSDLSASFTPTGTTTSGSNSITAVSSVAGLTVGMTVSGAGIPAGSVITSISGTTLTISANATASASGVALTIAVVQTWRLIDGSTILVTFTGSPLNTVRFHINARPAVPSTMLHIYPY
jgi:hypothetical protein